MAFIGIVGARKYKDQQSVKNLVTNLPHDSVIVTSACKGVCTWTIHHAKERKMDVLVYKPDLTNICSRFDIPKRYYQRNRELIEKCDFVHAFISKENGYTGGTRFEIQYAAKIRKPVELHWEDGISEIFYQHHFHFRETEQSFFLRWETFFNRTLKERSS